MRQAMKLSEKEKAERKAKEEAQVRAQARARKLEREKQKQKKVQKPFTPGQAVAKLRDEQGAKDYDNKGPPTETSVGFAERDFETLQDKIWELLQCLPHLKQLKLYKCAKLKELPTGMSTLVAHPSPIHRRLS